MDWVRPEFGDFLAPPKKRQKRDVVSEKEEISTEILTLPNLSQLTKYSPRNKEDLVVNKKKIEELEWWLKNIQKECSYLLLTGPPGSGKLKTLSVLCNCLKIECMEWNSPATPTYDPENPSFYQSELNSFEEFILRASRYSNVLCSVSKRLIAVKDIPNIFLRDNSIFQAFLERFFEVKDLHIVFIISDNVIGRTLFPENTKNKYKVKNINFNPVTQKSILLALNNLIKKFEILKINPLAESYLNEISVMCNGDLRNAINMLHFLLAKGKNCSRIPLPIKKKQKGKSKIAISSGISHLNSDNKIDIFHGLGRVLYSKRENGKLVHNPQEVADSFISSPNLFLSMLHENYLHTFSSVHDIAEATRSLVVTDLLSIDWNENSSLLGCGISIATHGLMISNSAPIKKFQQFNGCQIKRETIIGETKNILESSNHFWKGNDILLDIAPYASKIPYLEYEQAKILQRLANYS